MKALSEFKGVQFVLMRHDGWCAAARSQRQQDCICNAVMQTVTQDVWESSLNRDQRRRAAKQARRKGAR